MTISNSDKNFYKFKYLKYKTKYTTLKNMSGGIGKRCGELELILELITEETEENKRIKRRALKDDESSSDNILEDELLSLEKLVMEQEHVANLFKKYQEQKERHETKRYEMKENKQMDEQTQKERERQQRDEQTQKERERQQRDKQTQKERERQQRDEQAQKERERQEGLRQTKTETQKSNCETNYSELYKYFSTNKKQIGNEFAENNIAQLKNRFNYDRDTKSIIFNHITIPLKKILFACHSDMTKKLKDDITELITMVFSSFLR